MDITTVSWSQMLAYLQCPRKHELSYFDNLERIPNAMNKSRMYGTVFHAAMAENLRLHDMPINHRIVQSRQAAFAALEEETLPQKTVMTGEGKVILDQSYYDMVNEIGTSIPPIIEFAIRNIDFTRFRPVKAGELFGLTSPAVRCDACDGQGVEMTYGRKCPVCNGLGYNAEKADALVIEWVFEYGSFKGIVDAVLYDAWSDEFILVDWKLRYAFPHDDVAAMDGQLAFYAALLNDMGARIRKTVMWQFRRAVPQLARLNQNGMPSVAAQTTTWEYWWETLPSDLRAKLNEAEWRATMEGKVKDLSYFTNPVTSPVTQMSSRNAMDNALLVLDAIRNAGKRYDDAIPAPAILSSNGCQYCDFFKLCANPFKYGGDATNIIQFEYRPRRKETPEEIEQD